ncbi:MAG: polyphosphate kinase 1 [Bacteroidota bacterium]|nr:polyphosphate kinase 1 [Bacteroidota bacterium]
MEIRKDFINRELSWLTFNHAVLQEAADKSVPMVERLRFLGIFSNNLDEFFKVRVASVKRLSELKVDTSKLTHEKPKILLNQIQKKVLELQNFFDDIFHTLLEELEKEGVYIINEKLLNKKQHEFVKDYFIEHLLPVISPIMLNNAKRFPPLKDKSIYLATKLSNDKPDGKFEYSLMELPRKTLPRFIQLPREGDKRFIILLDDVIRSQMKYIFRKFPYTNFDSYTIKITRDAELDIDNDLTKGFLEKISKGVKGRKKGQPVRFVYDKKMDPDLMGFLKTQLRIDNDDYLIPGGRYHNFKDFMEFPNIGPKNLEYQKLKPLTHPSFCPEESIFDLIDKKDILVYFPYHNFLHFVNLLREAAIDPTVTSIRITLYRVARVSKVINTLINASLNGKEVTVVIELQARFDEESNIYWSKKLEEAGAKVIFGIPGLKVHAKLLLIGRKIQKHEKTRYTSCISTGNFHEGTARVYSDVSLFTAHKKITREVRTIFNFIEFPYKPIQLNYLLVSPVFMRNGLVELIDNEIENVKNGKKASIILKLNNLVDRKMISKLYLASQAGVQITLIVRGICSLIPGVPGLSENIKATCIVGRFLEHSRIFIFENDGNELYYISSADWMTRNLDHRVEAVSPILDPDLQKELRHIIELHLSDNVKARIINDSQNNQYKKTGGKKINSQIEHYKFLSSHKS